MFGRSCSVSLYLLPFSQIVLCLAFVFSITVFASFFADRAVSGQSVLPASIEPRTEHPERRVTPRREIRRAAEHHPFHLHVGIDLVFFA